MITVNFPKSFYTFCLSHFASQRKGPLSIMQINCYDFQTHSLPIKLHVGMNVLDIFYHSSFIFYNFQFSHWKPLGNGVEYTSDVSLPQETRIGKLGIYPLVPVNHWLRTVLGESSPQLFQPSPQAEEGACSRTSSAGTGK